MKIQTLYFQSLKRLTQLESEEVDLRMDATLADLSSALAARHPSLAPHAPSLLFAVNGEHADRSRALNDGDVVALMPPFSGG